MCAWPTQNQSYNSANIISRGIGYCWRKEERTSCFSPQTIKAAPSWDEDDQLSRNGPNESICKQFANGLLLTVASVGGRASKVNYRQKLQLLLCLPVHPMRLLHPSPYLVSPTLKSGRWTFWLICIEISEECTTRDSQIQIYQDTVTVKGQTGLLGRGMSGLIINRIEKGPKRKL